MKSKSIPRPPSGTALGIGRSRSALVLIRDPLDEFDPQALLSTGLDHTPLEILSWFVRQWRMEVTFEEARAHVGIETRETVE